MALLYQIYRYLTDETDRTSCSALKVVPKVYPINGVKAKNVVGIRLLVMASMRATQAHELAKVMNYQGHRDWNCDWDLKTEKLNT